MDCPFTGRSIALLPASNPNVAIIHVQAADIYGNCIIRGTDATCPELAMASAHSIVTCEQIVSHELVVRNPKDVMIPFPAVDAVIKVPFGAYPGACRRHYHFNGDHIRGFHSLVAPICKGGSRQKSGICRHRPPHGRLSFGKLTHAPGLITVFEAGAVGHPLLHGLPLSVGDSKTFTGASYVKGLNEAFELTKRNSTRS